MSKSSKLSPLGAWKLAQGLKMDGQNEKCGFPCSGERNPSPGADVRLAMGSSKDQFPPDWNCGAQAEQSQGLFFPLEDK